MTDFAKIEKELSPAMKKTVLEMSGNSGWTRDLRTLEALERRGLAEETGFFRSRLTAIGVRLKAIMEKPDTKRPSEESEKC